MAVEDVDGALVGGASLKAVDFLAIAKGCPLAKPHGTGGADRRGGNGRSDRVTPRNFRKTREARSSRRMQAPPDL